MRLRAPRPRDLGSRRTNARETRLSTKPHRLKCAARLARSLRATLAHAHAKETARALEPEQTRSGCEVRCDAGCVGGAVWILNARDSVDSEVQM